MYKSHTLLNLKCIFAFLFTAFFLTGCSGYSQEEVDSIKNSYESTIADLQLELDSANEQIETLQSRIDELLSTPTVPAGMSDDMYAYGISLLNSIDDYLAGNITLVDCFDYCQKFMPDLLLANKTSLNQVDKDCFENMINCYFTINNLANEDFTEYTQEDYEYVLPQFRDMLANDLGIE